jgi:hypothetical protein
MINLDQLNNIYFLLGKVPAKFQVNFQILANQADICKLIVKNQTGETLTNVTGINLTNSVLKNLTH